MYTSEKFAQILARDAQQRNSQESELQTYEVIGEVVEGMPYRDGTKPRNWYVMFQYPHTVKQVVAIKGVLVWKKVH